MVVVFIVRIKRGIGTVVRVFSCIGVYHMLDRWGYDTVVVYLFVKWGTISPLCCSVDKVREDTFLLYNGVYSY